MMRLSPEQIAELRRAADAGPFGAERRAEPRVPTNVRGRVFYGRKMELWADAVIRDRSASGAKIEASRVYPLSARLVLVDLEAGVAFEAILRWRKGDLAGLKLEVVHDLSEPAPEWLGHIQREWESLAPTMRRTP